jgi:broad specificity phosphatase PhoE
MIVVLRHAESQDNLLPCSSLLAPNGVHDPLLTKTGAQQALDAGRALRELGYQADAAVASTLMRAQQTALLALDPNGSCGGTRVYVAPHIAETHWGIARGCRAAVNGTARPASSPGYRCNVFHPASCNEEWPAVQRQYLAAGRSGGAVFPRCAAGVGVGNACASRVSYDLVGGIGASYCSHADRWGQPNWPQFWSWLWQEERLWRHVASAGRERPTLAIVSHGNLLERLLGGHHPANAAAYAQIVPFGRTPISGIGLFVDGWRCIHACGPEDFPGQFPESAVF